MKAIFVWLLASLLDGVIAPRGVLVPVTARSVIECARMRKDR